MSLPEKGRVAQRRKRPIGQPRQTPVTMIPRLKKKDVSVNMLNTRSKKEEKEMKDTTEEKLRKRKSKPVAEVDLETPERSIVDVEKKTTGSTPMPNAEELAMGTNSLALPRKQ